MKSITKLVKSIDLVAVLFSLLIVFRFMWIDTLPPGMQYDELEYSLSSKTFQLMGTDLSGVPFPQTLVTTNTLGKVSPIPYMILSPLWNFIDLNMATYRSLYVILNVCTALTFMVLLSTIFKNKNIALLGGILFLLNPWSFFLSRHGMDGSFALLFYMLGAIYILKNYSRKNMIISFLFFFLGCFSYHGAKLYLVPVVTILSVYKLYSKKLSKKVILPYLILIGSLIITVAAFVIGGKLLAGSILDTRSHEFVFTNTDKFSGKVDSLRTASLQFPLQKIMINKWLSAGGYFIGNYFQAFSPTVLFIRGEVMEFQGFFYLFEAALLLFGFAALFQKNRPVFWLITALTAIIPLSTATSLSGFSILNRAILLLPMLLIYITYGLYTLYETAIKYIPKKLAIASIGLIYLGSFIYFQYTYFFILPIQTNMHYQTNTRVLAKYLSYEKNRSEKIVIVADKPQVIFSGIVFYLPRNKQEELLKQMQTSGKNTSFTIDNITITLECAHEFDPKNTYIIDHNKELCYKEKIPAKHFIQNQKDAGIDFSIVGGKACGGYALSSWRFPHFLSDFEIEQMNQKQFCERWIAKPIPTAP